MRYRIWKGFLLKTLHILVSSTVLLLTLCFAKETWSQATAQIEFSAEIIKPAPIVYLVAMIPRDEITTEAEAQFPLTITGLAGKHVSYHVDDELAFDGYIFKAGAVPDAVPGSPIYYEVVTLDSYGKYYVTITDTGSKPLQWGLHNVAAVVHVTTITDSSSASNNHDFSVGEKAIVNP